MLAPRREQLTGDEAHERVRAMLAETVDTDLWRAQRVLQVGVDRGGGPVRLRCAVPRARRGGRAIDDTPTRRRCAQTSRC